jgi:3-hydroxyisobutyrate dehydrogenase-like beta-hydroxyacid dehydrogenase
MNPGDRGRLARLGVRIAESPSDAVDTMPQVLICLPNQKVLASVLDEIAPALSPGQIVIDATPATPDAPQRTSESLSANGVKYLDACVLSTSDQVRHGQGLVLVCGSLDAFEQCTTLWPVLGSSIMHAGPHGNGARMKQVSETVAGLNRAALAEGMVLARHFCLDPMQSLEVLRTTTAYSRVMDASGHKMLQGDFKPGLKLSGQLDALREVITAASNSNLQLVMSEAHRELLERATRKGCADMDASAVISAYDPAQQPPRASQ